MTILSFGITDKPTQTHAHTHRNTSLDGLLTHNVEFAGVVAQVLHEVRAVMKHSVAEWTLGVLAGVALGALVELHVVKYDVAHNVEMVQEDPVTQLAFILKNDLFR